MSYTLVFIGTFSKFLEDSFDPKSYANTIIQSRAVGESLAKLANGVSLLDKELHDQVGFCTLSLFPLQF